MSPSKSRWSESMFAYSLNMLQDMISHLTVAEDQAEFRSLVNAYRLYICSIIEDCMEAQVVKQELGDFHGTLGERFLQLSRDRLHEYAREAFAEFVDELQITPGGNLPHDSILASSKAFDTFFLNIDELYGFVDLENFVPLEVEGEYYEDDEEVLPEHIANHEFELYEDDDWFSNQYVLNTDLQDVLLGPEHAELADVSDLAPAKEESTCGVCCEADGVMHKIIVCGHIFCADCLSTQLETQHECRYRCSLCRADFFPQAAAPVNFRSDHQRSSWFF